MSGNIFKLLKWHSYEATNAYSAGDRFFSRFNEIINHFTICYSDLAAYQQLLFECSPFTTHLPHR